MFKLGLTLGFVLGFALGSAAARARADKEWEDYLATLEGRYA